MSDIRYMHEVTIKKLDDNQYLTKLLMRQVKPVLTKWTIQKQKVFDHNQVLEFVKLCKKDGMDIRIRKLV